MPGMACEQSRKYKVSVPHIFPGYTDSVKHKQQVHSAILLYSLVISNAGSSMLPGAGPDGYRLIRVGAIKVIPGLLTEDMREISDEFDAGH